MTPSKEAEAMREAIIAAIPGGSICDPQRICDMIRALPAIPTAVVSIPVIKEGARIDGVDARAYINACGGVEIDHSKAAPAAPASDLTLERIVALYRAMLAAAPAPGEAQ